ncbi:MAG: hypothetical protein II674_02575 [Prevotella sp.]|nr:hypothetical protein [Prevotella sp.]MBR7053795.1 hypothetical protein [Prevotella sp.]
MMRKRKKKRFGVALLVSGFVLLAAGYPTGMVNHNWYLIACGVLMLSGLVLYVAGARGDGRYPP